MEDLVGQSGLAEGPRHLQNVNPGVFDDSGTRVMTLGAGSFIVLLCGIIAVFICGFGVATPLPK